MTIWCKHTFTIPVYHANWEHFRLRRKISSNRGGVDVNGLNLTEKWAIFGTSTYEKSRQIEEIQSLNTNLQRKEETLITFSIFVIKGTKFVTTFPTWYHNRRSLSSCKNAGSTCRVKRGDIGVNQVQRARQLDS